MSTIPSSNIIHTSHTVSKRQSVSRLEPHASLYLIPLLISAEDSYKAPYVSHTTTALSVRMWRTISGQYVGMVLLQIRTQYGTVMVAYALWSGMGINTVSVSRTEYVFQNIIQILSPNSMPQYSFGSRKTAQFNFHVFHDVHVFHAVFNFNGGLNVFSGVEITIAKTRYFTGLHLTDFHVVENVEIISLQ